MYRSLIKTRSVPTKKMLKLFCHNLHDFTFFSISVVKNIVRYY